MTTDPSGDALFLPLVEQAIELAAEWHDGTYRKGSWRDPVLHPPNGEESRVPVMAHLTAVAGIVQRARWPAPVVAAAYLHDTLEDRDRHGRRLKRNHLRDAMGEEVTTLVEYVSETKLDEAGNPRPWRDRKEGYIATLQAAPDEAIAISLADKLHNLWSMNQSLDRGMNVFESGPNRKALSAGPDQQLWFYRSVYRVAEDREDERLPSMRRRLVRELERFADQVSAGA
jgi:(p)ppGpp synthase/HD superfamily hydrolase